MAVRGRPRQADRSAPQALRPQGCPGRALHAKLETSEFYFEQGRPGARIRNAHKRAMAGPGNPRPRRRQRPGFKNPGPNFGSKSSDPEAQVRSKARVQKLGSKSSGPSKSSGRFGQPSRPGCWVATKHTPNLVFWESATPKFWVFWDSAPQKQNPQNGESQ